MRDRDIAAWIGELETTDAKIAAKRSGVGCRDRAVPKQGVIDTWNAAVRRP